MKKGKGSRLTVKRAGKALCAFLLVALLIAGLFPKGTLAQEEAGTAVETVDAYGEEAISDPEGDMAAGGSGTSRTDPSSEPEGASETVSTQESEIQESENQESENQESETQESEIQESSDRASSSEAQESHFDSDSQQMGEETSNLDAGEASEESLEEESKKAEESKQEEELLLSAEEAEVMLMAIQNEYVGFAKTTYGSTTSLEFAKSQSGHGVNKYYLASKQVFDYYIDKNNTWSAGFSQNDLIAASQVAYCFNYHHGYPEPAYSQTNAMYDETQHSTAAFFYTSTSGYARTTNQTELYNRVLGVALNGYPNNATNIRYTYGLTADEFRYLTQYAIWYWTDNIDLEFNTTYKAYRVVDRITGQVLEPKNGQWLPDYADHRYENAYKDLINSAAGSSSANYINLYRNAGGQNFQNLLAVGQEEPPQSTTGLKLTKLVTGDGGETERYFNFTVTVLNNVRRPISGTYTVTPSAISGVSAPNIRSLTFDQNGQATLQLRHGQTIQIDGLPLGYFYTVRELEADTEQKNYRTSVSNSSDTENDKLGNTNMHKPEGAKSLQALTFTNHRIKEVPDNKVSVSIQAKKTMDGEAPGSGNIFSFQLIDQSGTVLQTVQNDADGKIRFAPLTYDRSGIYIYTIKEINDGKSGITYDTAPRTVTVTISGDDFGLSSGLTYYATGENNDYSATNRFLMNDDTTGESFRVFCLNYQSEWPNSFPTENFRYNRQRIPSMSDLENYVDRNQYGDHLIDVLKKVTYYNEYLATSLTEMDKKQLIWCASGSKEPAHTKWQSKIDEIIRTVQVPDNYNLELYIPENGNNQAFIRGTLLNTTVTQNEVVFNNTTGSPVVEGASLKLTKTVAGTAGETDRRFNFTITLMDENWGRIRGTFPVNASAQSGQQAPSYTQLSFDQNGQASVQLSHGQTIEITELPKNFRYQINEAEFNQDGYKTTLTADPNSNYDGVIDQANVVFQNEKNVEEKSLSITKTVTGNGDKDQLFTFTINLYDKNGALLRGKFRVESSAVDTVEVPSYTELDFARGSAVIQLKHGQSVKINGLPGDGYRYSVTETEANQNGYTTTNPEAPAQERFNAVTESRIVAFVNHKDAEYVLKVTKNNENKELLKGAGFKLYTDEACTAEADVFMTEDKTVSQKNASMEQLMTAEDGVIRFYGLKPGTYYLKEVRTPSGYSLLEDAVKVEINEDGTVTVNGVDKTPEGPGAMEIAVTVTDTSVQLTIPQSGFGGTLPFMAAALFLMLIAFMGSLILHHKKRWSCDEQGSHKE